MKRHMLRKIRRKRMRNVLEERAACIKAMSVIVMDNSSSDEDELSQSLPAKKKQKAS